MFIKKLVVNTLITTAFVVSACTSSITKPEVASSRTVLELTQDLAMMETSGVIYLASDRTVMFDQSKARTQGVDGSSINLAIELVGFTNEVVRQSKQSGDFAIKSAPSSLEAFPLVADFFTKVAAYDTSKQFKIQGWWEELGQGICGYWGNWKPTRAADYKWYLNVSNPAEILRSWGYHITPGDRTTGGGWTRDQQYNSWICGVNAFRDQGYVYDTTTFWEQNYEGMTPRGEPNVEVWRVFPWPYPLWPAYVIAWHTVGPGR